MPVPSLTLGLPSGFLTVTGFEVGVLVLVFIVKGMFFEQKYSKNAHNLMLLLFLKITIQM